MNTCFACGRKLGANPKMVDTKEDQAPYVGIECYRKIADAGSAGWQPPKGGPRLYVITPERRSQLAKKGILTDSVSPVPVAGKFANGCPFCKANHDPGIPCRNSQPRTGLTKPERIFKDGKLVGVNMVPVGDAMRYESVAGKSRQELEEMRKAYQRIYAESAAKNSRLGQDIDLRQRCQMMIARIDKQLTKTKATDSIALSRGEARTLLSVLKTTR